MSHDVIALVRGAPDVRSAVASVAAGAGLRMQEGDDQTLRLSAPDGAQVSVETPQPVQVPGEVERLLDARLAAQVPVPLWWVEARAAAGNPHAPLIARQVADELVRRFGGVVWEPPVPGVAGPPAGPTAPGPERSPSPPGAMGPPAPVSDRPAPDTGGPYPAVHGPDARRPDAGVGDPGAGDIGSPGAHASATPPDGIAGPPPQYGEPSALSAGPAGPATGPQQPVGASLPFGADPSGDGGR